MNYKLNGRNAVSHFLEISWYIDGTVLDILVKDNRSEIRFFSN